jgi:hypothetical protein
MDFMSFKNILNNKIFDNSKSDLIKKITEGPDRYIGLFRPTKPKAKLLQNLLQSNEIRFGDAFETIFEKYFEILGYQNLEKNIKTDDKYLSLDQLFTDNNYVYFVEQKIRDDHDSTKKRGQIENFEKKIIELLKIYKEDRLKCFTYFIDPSLTKNKNFYREEIKKIKNDYNVECQLCYGDEFWQKINHIEIWNELLKYLEQWKQEIPDLPNINFDECAEQTFDEIKKLSPSIYRKLLNNQNIINEIFPIIFPQNKVLKLLKEYFNTKTETIYQNLKELIKC